MKKILFIIQSYPSNRSANVLCDDKIMSAMVAKGGYEIHSLVYRFHGQKLYEEINGIKVHRFRRGKWWDLYTYARDNEKHFYCRMIVKINRLYMRLRQFACIPIYPNYEPLLARLVAKEAIKLHNKEHFDLVVAEHSGRDTLYAGAQLKKKDKGIKLVSILWDPFSGKDLARYLPHWYADYMMQKDECKILRYSDRIVCLYSNKKYQDTNSKNKSFYPNIRFLDIPGIIRPSRQYQEESFTKKGMINMLYSGILSLPDRDPTMLIKILNSSKYAGSINLQFFVAGAEGTAKAKNLLKIFKGKYTLHPYVPKKQLDSIAAHSDILINIGGPNPRMVPSKIFEYMSLGKPIFSTYYIDNDSSKGYLCNYPAAVCVDIRKPIAELTTELDFFLDKKLHSVVPFEEVEGMFPLNTPSKYIDVFDELLQ